MKDFLQKSKSHISHSSANGGLRIADLSKRVKRFSLLENKKGMVSLGSLSGGSGKPAIDKHDDLFGKKPNLIVGIHPTTHTRSV